MSRRRRLKVATIPTASGAVVRSTTIHVEMDEHHERAGTSPVYRVEELGRDAMILDVPLAAMGFDLDRGRKFEIVVLVKELPRSRKRPRKNPFQ